MDLILTGVMLPEVENRSLEVLLAAARRTGARAEIVAFDGFRGMERTLAAILARRPRICGLSLQTSEAALATMVLARMLRARGFDGRIVCGGHFASLNAEAILHANDAIDAVVRLSGEAALTGLLAGARSDEQLGVLPGMVFRARDGRVVEGAPASLGAPELSARGAVAAPSLHLGLRATDLILSRGCEASCGYCCIAAASRLARREQRRGGTPDAGHARASIEDIADHLADLHHTHDVRIVNVMDDNLLPLEPREVARWTRELHRALCARGATELAFSMQIRADALVPESADALAELGLVRAYVGIDGYSAQQLHALGRRADASAGARALSLLWERRVLAVANALLVGPTLGFESVSAEIEALSRIRHAPVHLLPLEARPGTPLHARAERMGLLEGGFLLQHYRFRDRRTELLGRVLTSLPTRLAERSVPIALYDLGYNLGIARRLMPEAARARLFDVYAGVTEAWNRDQIRLLRAAAVFAGALDERAIDALIERELPRVTEHDRALLETTDAALRELEAAVRILRGRGARAHVRGQLLGALALSMSLAGCTDTTADGRSDGAEPMGPPLAPSSAGTGGTTIAAGGAGGTSGGGAGGQSAAMAATGGGGVGGNGGTGSVDAGEGGTSGALAQDAGDIDDAGAGCETQAQVGELPFCCAGAEQARVTFDAAGKPVSFAHVDGTPISPELDRCLKDLLRDYCYPSLAGTSLDISSHCWIA